MSKPTSDHKVSPSIAICGYSHRLPGGLEDDKALWDLLASRGFVQEQIDQCYGKGSIPWDGFVESPKMPASPYEGLIKDGKELEFDCSLFGMSANDAMRTDPQIKMLLSVTWEALECAGLDQVALHNSNTGVFVGCQDSSRFGWKAPYGATSGDMPGKTGSMIANRVSYHFNWMGKKTGVRFFMSVSAPYLTKFPPDFCRTVHVHWNGLFLCHQRARCRSEVFG